MTLSEDPAKVSTMRRAGPRVALLVTPGGCARGHLCVARRRRRRRRLIVVYLRQLYRRAWTFLQQDDVTLRQGGCLRKYPVALQISFASQKISRFKARLLSHSSFPKQVRIIMQIWYVSPSTVPCYNISTQSRLSGRNARHLHVRTTA